MLKTLPPRPDLDWLRKTAKQLLAELRRRDPSAKLADAQLELARDHGFTSWRALKAHCESMRSIAPAGEREVEESIIAQLLRDARGGNLVAVRATLAARPDLVNALGKHPHWGGRPQPLHMAVEGKHRAVFDLLVAAGADVNGDNTGYGDWTPLMLAIYNDQPFMRDELRRRGARVGIIEALMLGDDALVEQLLSPGRAALPEKVPGGASLLTFARTTRAIDRLLDLGVPIDTVDQYHYTPKEALSALGVRGGELLRHLARRGAPVRPREFARLGDLETVSALVAQDPAIARDDQLFMAAIDSGNRTLVEWLLGRGANPNARSTYGSQAMALHGAAWSGDLQIVKLLLAAGADPHGLDVEHQNTPSGYARVSARITGNAQCIGVAEYLEKLAGEPPG
jgi:ankyrin repeat protein